MERTYYILRNNQQDGPFTRQEILQMALPDQTLLWSEGWTRWQPLSQVEDFSTSQEGSEFPPALPGVERKGPVREYHLADLREQIGVFTLEELRRDPSPLRQAKWVWYQGLTEWIALDKEPEIAALLSAQAEEGVPTPPPAESTAATPPPYHGASASSEVPPSFTGTTREGVNAQSRVYAPEPSLWNYFVTCITKRFAQFSGRARRREFWGFVLYTFIFRYVIQIFSSLAFFPSFFTNVLRENVFNVRAGVDFLEVYGDLLRHPGVLISYIILTALYLFFLIPSLAVSVRRMHDIGKSGWFLLITLIPVVGWLIFIIYAAREGVRYPNEYGEDPKAPHAPN